MEKVTDTYEGIRKFNEDFCSCIEGLKANDGWTAGQIVTGLKAELLTGSNEDKWTVFVAGSDKPPDENQMIRYLRESLRRSPLHFTVNLAAAPTTVVWGVDHILHASQRKDLVEEHSEPKPIQYHAAIALKLTLPINVQPSSLSLLNRETHL